MIITPEVKDGPSSWIVVALLIVCAEEHIHHQLAHLSDSDGILFYYCCMIAD